AILAGSLFYLDSFRSRLTTARLEEVHTEARMMGDVLSITPRNLWQPLLARLGQDSRTRLRIFGPDGTQLLDNWDIAPATYDLRDPAKEPWVKDMARLLDNAFDAIVGAKQPPPLTMPEPEHLQGWKE